MNYNITIEEMDGDYGVMLRNVPLSAVADHFDWLLMAATKEGYRVSLTKAREVSDGREA